ncbi:MAG TPA: hypothetical protein VGN74_11380 [Brevundimonas sp.]|jgi:hypothetical protein|uniref:hypothetical protein n=1 Tax=Brevundimonas sp. TaxID=1871086 RepID=UPI002E10AD12|nr:hypothetical protein [Brevundimonas sp.]
MGEAKRRQAELRDQLLRKADQWAFPPSQWEADTVAELKTLPVVTVERMSAQDIAYMRMPASECHGNCRWYEANDPTGTFRAVVGWLVDPEGNYVLHSVVSDGANYGCITPTVSDRRPFFEFIPDSKIAWQDGDDGYRHAIRDGHAIGPGVRGDPEKTIADVAEIKRKLLAGVHPLKAIEVV